MIVDLLTILRANTTLRQQLDATAAEDHIYARHTDYTGKCLIYDVYTTLANKIQEQNRLTITIVAETLSEIDTIEEEVKRSILTLADNQLTNNILQVELNGGGSLYDYDRQKHHRTLYFTLISRSEI